MLCFTWTKGNWESLKQTVHAPRKQLGMSSSEGRGHKPSELLMKINGHLTACIHERQRRTCLNYLAVKSSGRQPRFIAPFRYRCISVTFEGLVSLGDKLGILVSRLKKEPMKTDITEFKKLRQLLRQKRRLKIDLCSNLNHWRLFHISITQLVD